MLADRQPALWTSVMVIALLVAIGITFGAARDGGFVSLDDGNNIFLHPQLGTLTWDRVLWAWSDFSSARRYLPLGWLGFSAVVSAQGYHPAGFHLACIGWHALAAVALLGASRQILRRFAAPAAQGWADALAWLATAAWALHPLRAEVTAWASGLLYAQASALALVALWLWTLRWSASRGPNWLATGSLIAFLGSLLTYPIALGLPVVCWILDRSPGNGRAETTPASIRSVRQTGGIWVLLFVAASGLVLAANLAARGQKPEEFARMAPWSDFGIADRLLQALYVWGRYLQQWIWPAQPSPVYTDLFDLSAPSAKVVATAWAAAALLAAGLWIARRHRLILGSLLAYSAMALPFLGLLEHPWVAHDRYASLLSPVLGIAVAAGLLRVRTAAWRVTVVVAAGGLIIIGAAHARSLAGHWRDEQAFDARLRATLPRQAAAGYYLGYLPSSAHFLAGRFDAIMPTLAQAERDAPGWSADSTRDEFRRLVQQHEEFVARNWPGTTVPPRAVLHLLHGLAAMDRGDTQTARAHWEAALAVAPGFTPAAQALASSDGTTTRRR
ncbi:MAG: hypothetical protein KF897_15950 [Opitutaceae bacterium]|nr:hypothetical protein [Opitutaceae bacterium]